MNDSPVVVCIPDHPHWITNTIANAIIAYNDLRILNCPYGAVPALFQKFPLLNNHDFVVHFLTPHIFNLLNKSFSERPILTHIHHIESDVHLPSMNESDGVVCSCDMYFKKISEARNGYGVYKSGYGVDNELFAPMPNRMVVKKKLGLRDDEFVVAFAGKASSDTNGRKGLVRLSNNIVKLSRRIPNVRLLLIGPDWQALASSLKNAGVSTLALGYIESPMKLRELYCSANVFWVCSNIEGGPVPMLEAMSCGIPVISTPVGMALDMIQPNVNGFLTQFGDESSHAELSENLARDPELGTRIGIASRNTIDQGYSWRKRAVDFADIYSDIYDRTRNKRNLSSIKKNDFIRVKNWLSAYRFVLLSDVYRQLGMPFKMRASAMRALLRSRGCRIIGGQAFARLKFSKSLITFGGN